MAAFPPQYPYQYRYTVPSDITSNVTIGPWPAWTWSPITVSATSPREQPETPLHRKLRIALERTRAAVALQQRIRVASAEPKTTAPIVTAPTEWKRRTCSPAERWRVMHLGAS